jgi:hypothetical protein
MALSATERRSHMRIPQDDAIPVYTGRGRAGTTIKARRFSDEPIGRRIGELFHKLLGDVETLLRYDNADRAIEDLKNSGDTWNLQLGASVSMVLGGRADYGISVMKEDDGTFSIVKQGDAGPVETATAGPAWLEASEVFQKQVTYSAANVEEAKQLAHALMHGHDEGIQDVKAFLAAHRTQLSYIAQFTGNGSGGPTLDGLPDPLAQLIGADLSLSAEVQATVEIDVPKDGKPKLTLSGNGSFDVNGMGGLFPDSGGTPWLNIASADVNGAINFSKSWETEAETLGTLKTLEDLAKEALKQPATESDKSITLTVTGGSLGKLHAVAATIDLGDDGDAKAHFEAALKAGVHGKLGEAFEALGSTPINFSVSETKTFGIDVSQEIDVPWFEGIVIEPTIQADKIENVGGFSAKEMTGPEAFEALKKAVVSATMRTF